MANPPTPEAPHLAPPATPKARGRAGSAADAATAGKWPLALTVNGNIDATLGRANWDGELKFQAVNGSITVTFTGDLNAEVNATTVTGDIETDYPLQVQGRFMNRRIRGTVGSGGRTLSLATVNGSIELRRR